MGKRGDATNNTETIKRWVEDHSDAMYSWARYRTGNHEVAEDLVQDTFAIAVQSLEKFEGRSNPKTWLFAILNNKIMDHHRTKLRSGLAESINPATNRPFFDDNGRWVESQRPNNRMGGADEHLLDNPAFNTVLQGCMEKLPDRWFSAIQLKYLEEKKGKLICQELQIAPTNLWQILHRAKLQLRRCLENKWFTDE